MIYFKYNIINYTNSDIKQLIYVFSKLLNKLILTYIKIPKYKYIFKNCQIKSAYPHLINTKNSKIGIML